jgi:hypothetical protein
MDSVSLRFVWKHIDEIKENRAVILTTHAMEEADLLADSVAVSIYAIYYSVVSPRFGGVGSKLCSELCSEAHGSIFVYVR